MPENMIDCKGCGQLIHHTVVRCPKCGTPTPVPIGVTIFALVVSIPFFLLLLRIAHIL